MVHSLCPGPVFIFHGEVRLREALFPDLLAPTHSDSASEGSIFEPSHCHSQVVRQRCRELSSRMPRGLQQGDEFEVDKGQREVIIGKPFASCGTTELLRLQSLMGRRGTASDGNVRPLQAPPRGPVHSLGLGLLAVSPQSGTSTSLSFPSLVSKPFNSVSHFHPSRRGRGMTARRWPWHFLEGPSPPGCHPESRGLQI